MKRKAQKRLFALWIIVFLACLTAAAAAEVSPPLRITEIMASNGNTLEDAFGRHPDWIELHNEGAEPVSLEGFALSDRKDKLEKYTFAAGAVIQPDEYIIIFASGAKKDIADEYHASFKLSATGEAVYLSKGGVIIDFVVFGPLEKDISLALDEKGEYTQTLTPTPGAENQITPVPNE
ncbi:MAG: lamin tail domain-containing protein [Clostridia bacterium]|nr:lamin tail domain-containing protein [Clostridia bacterium]